MGVSVTADSVATSPGTTTEWTRTTLATQLLGELGVSARDSDGTAPDRLVNIILASFGYVWSGYDWQFRERTGTVTLAADDAAYALTTNHSDFAKVKGNLLRETSGNGDLILTTRRSRFEAVYFRWLDSTGAVQTGTPQIGYIEPDTSLGGYGVKLLLAPNSDGVYTYRMPYLCQAPSLGTTDTPKWPDWAFNLWYLHAKFEAQKAFVKGDGWETAYRHFAGQWARCVGENDEEHTESTSRMSADPHGDFAAMGFGGGYGCVGIPVDRD